MEMRQVFAQYLAEEMRKNENIVVVDADLARADGTLALRKEFPDRALDVGIAEADMVSVAAGLSSYGFIPFCTSFTPFMTRRVCDQVAISGAYAKSNIKCVGTDPGITAEYNGGTHMSVEDIGVMRSIPTIIIVEPCDETALHALLPQITAHEGVVYLRLFRKEAPKVYEAGETFDLHKAKIVREGKDITILCSGIMVKSALEAADALADKGVSAEVIDVFTVKPIDRETIVASAKKTGRVLTCENHNVVGGLYSAAAEVFCAEYPVKMRAIGIPDVFGEVGKAPALLEKFHMTVSDIVRAAEQMAKE